MVFLIHAELRCTVNHTSHCKVNFWQYSSLPWISNTPKQTRVRDLHNLRPPCNSSNTTQPIQPGDILFFFVTPSRHEWARWLSRYSDWLRAGRSGDRILVVARFSASVQTGPGGPSSLLHNGYRVFPRGKERQGSDVDPSPPSSAVVKKE